MLNRRSARVARNDMRDWFVKRRERTRQLIELGGLIAKAGLVALTDDDRAVIFGLLVEATAPCAVTAATSARQRCPAPTQPTQTHSRIRRTPERRRARAKVRPPPSLACERIECVMRKSKRAATSGGSHPPVHAPLNPAFQLPAFRRPQRHAIATRTGRDAGTTR